MKQGEAAECMYVLLIGKVSVFINRVKVVELTENNVLGEMALKTNAARSATVRAEVDSIFLKLERKAYEAVLSQLKSDEIFELTRVLVSYPCFASWSRDKVHLFTTIATSKIYNKGQGKYKAVIYEQGQESNALYIVRSGKVKLQAYVTVNMGNRWPTGKKMWENVKLNKTITIDVRVTGPGETFGGHEIVDSCPRITRAYVKTDAVIISINRAQLAIHFLKNEIQELLDLSRFMLPTQDQLYESARLKLRKVKDHVTCMQAKRIEDSIAADFHYSERTTVEDLRSRLMRRWIGSFNTKLKKANGKIRKDIISISKSSKYLTRLNSATKLPIAGAESEQNAVV